MMMVLSRTLLKVPVIVDKVGYLYWGKEFTAGT